MKFFIMIAAGVAMFFVFSDYRVEDMPDVTVGDAMEKLTGRDADELTSGILPVPEQPIITSYRGDGCRGAQFIEDAVTQHGLEMRRPLTPEDCERLDRKKAALDAYLAGAR